MADMAGRILALDVGDVRIGVAVSDPTGTIAQPLEVYRRVVMAPTAAMWLRCASVWTAKACFWACR